MKKINNFLRLLLFNKFNLFVLRFLYKIAHEYKNILKRELIKRRMGYIHPTCVFLLPRTITVPSKIFLYENTNIYEDAKFIISDKGKYGRFIMKRNSGSAQGLTVITGNHSTTPDIGKLFKEQHKLREGDIDKDIVVEEDVWIGANVTLLSGVVIGRGSIIGAGSVVRNSIPPYAIVCGNPAKVISFKFTPSEIIEHELILYPNKERLPRNLLEKNYNKFYLSRIKENLAFIKN